MQGTPAAARGDHRNRTAERHFTLDCKLPNGYEPKIGSEYDEAAADRRSKVAKLLQGKEAGDEKDVRLALSRTEPLVSGRRRDAGLDALSTIGYGREWVTNEILERLKKSAGGDQSFALEALRASTPRGQQKSLESLKPRLADPLPSVRRAALRAWGSLAEQGDPEAVTAVLPLLEDPEVIVRRSAMAALEELVHRPKHWCWGDTPVIAALCARLEDKDFDVQRSTVRALVFAAGKGDPQAICSVARLLEHKDPKVRNIAGEALQSITSPDDPLLATTVSRRLGKIISSSGKASEADTRATATRVTCILESCNSVSSRAVAEITKLVSVDSDAAVRCAATRALASAAKRGDPLAVSAARAACVDANLDVRREGGHARKVLEVRPWVPLRIRRKQEAKDAELLRCLPTMGAMAPEAPPVPSV
eukprot:gnl/MRDRNA2_/MRDRNA2_134200_c0_seq1.p1 gnl/MRDRNA2_/MRDRNA2_134200_c0~~gnl/MRDRNA2_/MRDRNA2_134200_c0_seq1.p1  ORF type:complete len:421 (+),score=98.78 gnl/MRDRNA2_/MRDRNA2_134200_c0_seq1:107-1369(+)